MSLAGQGGAAQGGGVPMGPPWDLSGKADSVAEVGRAIAETQVTSQPPKPEWSDWVSHVIGRLLERSAEWVGGSVAHIELLARLLAISLTSLLIVLLGAAIWRAYRHRNRRPASLLQRSGIAVAEPASLPPAPPVEVPIEALLERGNAAGALERLWWSLARSLEVPPREVSWTGADLVSRAEGDEILPLVVELERQTYGRDPATVARVRELWQRIASTLESLPSSPDRGGVE